MHKACPTVLCHRLHQPPVWASVKASFLSLVAPKTADRCWAYLSSSVIIYKRFTAGTQREVQVPLSRPNPAQFFSKDPALQPQLDVSKDRARVPRSLLKGGTVSGSHSLANEFKYCHFLLL